MASIASAATALPPHVLTQAEARACCARALEGRPGLARLLRVFDASGVERRHFAFPPDYYLSGRGFAERNADFIREATALAARAARGALERADTRPGDVDFLYLATTTGLATPGVDAFIVKELGLRDDVVRSPLFGLGCAGGAGAVARAAKSGGTALVVSVELCGQVFAPRDLRPVDVVGAALFGDGAAAVVVVDGESPGPRIAATRSVLFEGTRELMGWDFTGEGMRLRLSPHVPEIVTGRLREVAGAFLGGAKPSHWLLHPGGRRILEAYRAAFGLGDAELEWTRGSLARVGNLSSASVLFILSDLLSSGRSKPGDVGFLCALGPGFCAEMMALQW